MNIINNAQVTPSFGMKNNSKAAKKVLESVDPELKQTIVRGVNQFCDVTQRKGIKGELIMKKVKTAEDGTVLGYFIKPANSKVKTYHEVEVTPEKKSGTKQAQKTLMNKMLEELNLDLYI